MPKKKTDKLPIVAADDWLKLPSDQKAVTIPCVPCRLWLALSPEERDERMAGSGPRLMGDPPNPQACACLPFGSGPGMWVWDGFNPVYLPTPTGQGQWFPIWDSNNGWTWHAVN